MRIGTHQIGLGKPVFIIAEAGINHNGNILIAKKMIKKASECGVDAIKFQTIFPEELFSKSLNSNLYDFAKTLSFSKKQHLELKKYAKKNTIEFFSTPLGKKSTDLLDEIGVKIMKIASGELTNHELIKIIAKKRKPIFLSTGMATISEIRDAVKIIKKFRCPLAILHCNSSYPTPVEDANLSTIHYFQNLFKVPIGYSDHTLGNDACLIAVSLGACIIEKHFTLDKEMEGPDQKLSADFEEFSELVNRIRYFEKSIGSPRKGPTKSEILPRKLMRKSIGAELDIPAGTKLTKQMLCLIRPGTGISPTEMNHIVGKKIQKNIKKGKLLQWKMF